MWISTERKIYSPHKDFDKNKEIINFCIEILTMNSNNK